MTNQRNGHELFKHKLIIQSIHYHKIYPNYAVEVHPKLAELGNVSLWISIPTWERTIEPHSDVNIHIPKMAGWGRPTMLLRTKPTEVECLQPPNTQEKDNPVSVCTCSQFAMESKFPVPIDRRTNIPRYLKPPQFY